MTRAKSKLLGNLLTDTITTLRAAGTSVLDVALSRHCTSSDSNSLNQDPILSSAPSNQDASASWSFVTFPGVREEGEIDENDEMMVQDDEISAAHRYITA
jgi:hypothetical protein